MSHLLGHKGEVVVQRGCCNEHIRIANQLTSIAEVTANERKAPHDWSIGHTHTDTPEKPAEPILADPSAWTIVDALIDFTIGYQANGKGFVGQATEEITCCWCSFEC